MQFDLVSFASTCVLRRNIIAALSASPHGPTLPINARLNMSKIVRRTLSDTKLTRKQLEESRKLAAMPDGSIDFSDIPEATEKFWKNAVRNPWYRPCKKQVTLRIDADILAWLRQQGKGYQSRLNSLLRTAMLEQLRGKKRVPR
jgi:uncharacterized protein (DUF4415 family)